MVKGVAKSGLGRKAQSNIIAMVLIILMVLVAIVIFWNIFNPFVKEKSKDINTDVLNTNIQIKEASLYATGAYRIKIERISGNDKGIESISFVEDKANVIENPPCLRECVNQLNDFFNEKRIAFNINFKVKGSEFQKKVWDELMKIPFGKTTTYFDIAKKLGNKKAVRAVGNAIGKNPLAIIIPCHRVIGSDGKLTGYAGGIWRKKWLLNFERKDFQEELF